MESLCILLLCFFGAMEMYRINIKEGDDNIGVIRDKISADNISDVELMLTQVVGNRLDLDNIILIPLGEHNYLVFQVVGPLAYVSVEQFKPDSEGG